MTAPSFNDAFEPTETSSSGLPPRHHGDPPVEVAIDRDAVRAHAGERDVRDVLYCLLRPEMAKFVRRYAGWASGSGAWDLDDVWQETFLAFNEIVEDWRGNRGFVPYFYAVFPKRLATAVRRLDGRQPRMTSGLADEPSHDPGQAMDARAFVVVYLATLPRVERQLLALHVWEELPLAAVAEHLGLSLKETQRRWRVIRRSFRTQCAALLERDLSNGRPRRNPAT